ASGGVVPEARVSATNDATGAVTSTESSAAGDYVVKFLVPGTYRVSIEKQGFPRKVKSGGITRVDSNLTLGQMQQAVQVAANPLAVATETSELSKTFDFKQIDDL